MKQAFTLQATLEVGDLDPQDLLDEVEAAMWLGRDGLRSLQSRLTGCDDDVTVECVDVAATSIDVPAGARIRYTARLGAHQPDANVTYHVVNPGDEGVYVGPHPTLPARKEGWHRTHITARGVTLDCPARHDQFEVIP